MSNVGFPKIVLLPVVSTSSGASTKKFSTATHEEKSSQTKVITKESKVQTDTTRCTVTVKWSKSGQLSLPPGTVVLWYEEFDLNKISLNYPVKYS